MVAVKTMWALQLTGPSTFAMRDAVAPTARDLESGQVLVRSLAGGICGSDLPFFHGRPLPAPMSGPPHPGFSLHEIVGEVTASADDSIRVGERVVGWASASDGLAEYVVTLGKGLYAFSPALEPRTAVMLQPLACVLYAVARLGDVSGRSAAVLGLGPIGVLFGHVLKSQGASRVIGVDRVDRTDVAEAFGLDEAIHAHTAGWSHELAETDRADLVVEAIGHQVETLASALEAVAAGGTVYYFGIPNDEVYPLPLNQLLRRNATLKSGFTAVEARRQVLAEADEYLARFPELAEVYLTSRHSYVDAEAAFVAASHPRTGQMKTTFAID